eukprot:RCo006392
MRCELAGSGVEPWPWDRRLDYFECCQLWDGILLRASSAEIERPQHMLLRVCCGVFGRLRLPEALETYDLLSRGLFVPGPAILGCAGTPGAELSDSLVVRVPDSVEGTFDVLKMVCLAFGRGAKISVICHDVRAGTRGECTEGGAVRPAKGVAALLRMFSDALRYSSQRPRGGVLTVVLEPWHADLMDVLQFLKTPKDDSAPVIQLALWVPDLFMQRVERNGQWPLFCPSEAPGLSEACGDAFVSLFERYEAEGRARKKLNPSVLWSAIVDTQIKTGGPSMLFKDCWNRSWVHRSSL